MLVARSRDDGGRIIGYIVCWSCGRTAYPGPGEELSWRRKGIARKLVLSAIRQGDAVAHRGISRGAGFEHSSTLLYEGLGFTRSLIREGYYDMPTEDAVVMSLERDAWYLC